MKFTIRLSAIELYNEQCFDLLTTGHARLKPLQVRGALINWRGGSDMNNPFLCNSLRSSAGPGAQQAGLLRGQTDGS